MSIIQHNQVAIKGVGHPNNQEYLDGELDNKVSYFFSCYKIMVLNFKAMENAQMKQQKVMVV